MKRIRVAVTLVANAHVVAGGEMFSVDADGKPVEARVVSYDPKADIAILDVPGLSAEPLEFAGYTAGTGVDALVLGYPSATSFRASPARIREVTGLKGPLYFGAVSNDSTTGFAMTAEQVRPQMARAYGTQPADTGDCVF